jgi:hypothetical protein
MKTPHKAIEERLEFQSSVHAEARQRQRGLTRKDLELIQRYGEQVDDGWVLSDRALELARKDIKRTLQRLDHLAGVAVVEKGGTIVTAYRATGRRVKRLRDGEKLGAGAARFSTMH